jgi:lipopolysaccharide biosynthesis glycosyltransferase
MNKTINLALCFDERLWMQAGVAIASALINSSNSYSIHCVISKYVSSENRAELQHIANKFGINSTILFMEANNDFNDAKCEGFYISSYFRLMLPMLLPNLDKVLYLDSDTVVCRDLYELYNFDLGDNLLAGVKDVLNYKETREGISSPYEYVNAGVLLFNLKQIRKEKLYNMWVETAKTNSLKYFDQDILNLTCKNRIAHLPLKFNYFPRDKREGYKKSVKYGIHTKKEVEEARKTPAVYHFIHIKPWNKPAYLSNVWWKYAKLTPFYNRLAENYMAGNYIAAAIKKDMKRVYFLGFLPVLSVETEQDKILIKLFGVIPLVKIKVVKE